MTHIILGVSGSISAYKTPELVRLLHKEGWKVTPVLTRSAEKFVTELSLSTVSGTECLTMHKLMKPDIPHIRLAKSGDLFLNAPSSAHTLSKFVSGQADDPVSALFSAFLGPTIVAPAMHTEMWEHPNVQSHINHLRNQSVRIVGPDYGDLARGDQGVGRLASPHLIVLAIYASVLNGPDLSNKHIVITAGGTSEPIDSVRSITNHSTGQSGEILAHMASFLGARVSLITSKPLVIPNPHLHEVITVNTVDSLSEALLRVIPDADRLYMKAAVSDYSISPLPQKLKRSGSLNLELTQTPDLLKNLNNHKKKDARFIGFCLEDVETDTVAKRKLSDKNLDAIVANNTQQLGQNKRSATIHIADGRERQLIDLNLPSYAIELLKIDF